MAINGMIRSSCTLKLKAATLVGARLDLNYETALTEVSKKFVEHDVSGSTKHLNPLIGSKVASLVQHLSGALLPPVICKDVTKKSSASSIVMQVVFFVIFVISCQWFVQSICSLPSAVCLLISDKHR